MSLDDIQKNLYKPEADFQNRPMPSADFAPGAAQEPQPEKQWQEIKPKITWRMRFASVWNSVFSFNPAQKKYFLIGGIILLLLIGGLIVWVYYWTPFDQNKVGFSISGPERVISGEDVTYVITCKNDTKIALTDVQVIFFWPENSISDSGSELTKKVTLENILPGEREEIEFKGKIIGLKGSRKEVKATLNYQPAEINAKYAKDASFTTDILSVPLVLDFDLPERTTSGQQITVALKYLNDSDSAFENLIAKIEYPDGFKVSSSFPQPQENAWQIGTLQPKAEGKILLTGTIEGNRGDSKTFKGYLGAVKDGNFVAYSDTVKSSQISLPALSLEQSINNSSGYIANPSDTLNFKIKYQNNSTLGIPSVKITSRFDSKVLDFYSLDLKDRGNFDNQTNTISWDQNSVPELELVNPGQSGELAFSVKVKDAEKFPISSFNDKNFAVVNVSTIDSSNIPLALIDQQVKDTLETVIKVNSKISVSAKSYYQDSILPNSGPVPPVVGQTTTYTVHWAITNSSNDIDNAKVEAVLPSYVEWVNKYKPASTIVRYDSLTRKLTWEIGKLAAGTGVLTPAKIISFQIALTPSSTQLNQVVDLLRISTIFGKDSYTNADLSASDKAVTSDCPDDSTMSWEKGRVGR